MSQPGAILICMIGVAAAGYLSAAQAASPRTAVETVESDIARCTQDGERPSYGMKAESIPSAAELARWRLDPTAWLFDEPSELLETSKAVEYRSQLAGAAAGDRVARVLLALLDLEARPDESLRELESVADSGDAGAAMLVYRARIQKAPAHAQAGAKERDLERAVRNGHPHAMAMLAVSIDPGSADGVARAVELLRRGAAAGDPAAMSMYGTVLAAKAARDGNVSEESLALWRRAAELGSNGGMLGLARARWRGAGVTHSDEAALACARVVAGEVGTDRLSLDMQFAAHQIIADILLRRPELRQRGKTEGVAALEQIGRTVRDLRLASRRGAPPREDLERWGLTLSDWFGQDPQALFVKANGYDRFAEITARRDADPVSSYLHAAGWLFDAQPERYNARIGVRLMQKIAAQGNAAAAYHLCLLDELEPGKYIPRAEGARWKQQLRDGGDPRALETALQQVALKNPNLPVTEIYTSADARLVREAMEAGSPIGLWLAARAYNTGEGGFEVWPERSHMMFLALGELGAGTAWKVLGFNATHGVSAEQSPALAAHWYGRAIRAGSGDASLLPELTREMDSQSAAARRWPASAMTRTSSTKASDAAPTARN